MSIIAPLLVAYRSQGFWMRSATYQEQAEVPLKLRLSSRIDENGQVHFRHEALMLLELSNGAQLGWSTLPGLTALLGEGVSYFWHSILWLCKTLLAVGIL